MPDNRHRLTPYPTGFSPSSPVAAAPTNKVPRIPLDRRRDGRDFRIERHAARGQRRTLAERGKRMQVTKAPDPEERRAERDAYAPRAAFLFPTHAHTQVSDGIE